MSYKLVAADMFSEIVTELFGDELTFEWRKCEWDEWDWCEQFNLCLEKVFRKMKSTTGVEYLEVLFDESLNRNQNHGNRKDFYEPLGRRLGFDLAKLEGIRFDVTYIFAKEVDDRGKPQAQILIGGGCIY
jgi:hypothetical protein